MLDPKTLRGRLTLAYAGALVGALAIFAATSLVILDRTQRSTLDQQLATAARALGAIVDVKHGRIDLDGTDRVQFLKALGVQLDGAILDERGATLVSSTTEVPNAVAALAATSRPGLVLSTIATDSGPVRTAVAAVPRTGGRAGTIVVWRDEEAIEALDRRAIAAFGLAIPIVVGLAILAGGYIARRALAPLARIAELATEIEAHDLSARLDLPPRDDDLGRLCATFDRMLERLEAAFERERRFTSDASHELRTPLSVIRAEADLALRRERSPSEYRAALETIAQEADELEGLTRDLLAAARGEVASTHARGDLGAITADVCERMTVLADARRVTIAQHVASGAIVGAEPSTIARLVVALLHNALKHARDGGRVDVTVARGDEGAATLVIRDDGPGFTPEALARAFDRFWRGHATEGDGSGLGLAITRTLVDRLGGTIGLANAPGGGAEVTIRFATIATEA